MVKIYYVYSTGKSACVLSWIVCQHKVIGTVILLPLGVPFWQAEKDTFKIYNRLTFFFNTNFTYIYNSFVTIKEFVIDSW